MQWIVAPWYNLNYERLIVSEGQDHWFIKVTPSIMAGIDRFFDFVQGEPLRWSVLGGLVVLFTPIVWHTAIHLYGKAELLSFRLYRAWRAPIRNRQNRIQLGREAVALARSIYSFASTHYNRNTEAALARWAQERTNPPSSAAEMHEARLAAQAYYQSMTDKFRQEFLARLMNTTDALQELGYLNNEDVVVFQYPMTNELVMLEVATRLDGIARRLLADNGAESEANGS